MLRTDDARRRTMDVGRRTLDAGPSTPYYKLTGELIKCFSFYAEYTQNRHTGTDYCCCLNRFAISIKCEPYVISNIFKQNLALVGPLDSCKISPGPGPVRPVSVTSPLATAVVLFGMRGTPIFG